LPGNPIRIALPPHDAGPGVDIEPSGGNRVWQQSPSRSMGGGGLRLLGITGALAPPGLGTSPPRIEGHRGFMLSIL